MEKSDKIVAIVSLVATALIAVAASISTVVVSKTQVTQTRLSVSARSAISMLRDQALKSEQFFIAIDQLDRLAESSPAIDVEQLRIIAKNANNEISRLRPHLSAELAEISGELGLEVDKLLDFPLGSDKFKTVVFNVYNRKLKFRDAYYKERSGLWCIAFPSRGKDCEDIKPLIEPIKSSSAGGGVSQPEQFMWP